MDLLDQILQLLISLFREFSLTLTNYKHMGSSYSTKITT